MLGLTILNFILVLSNQSGYKLTYQSLILKLDIILTVY